MTARLHTMSCYPSQGGNYYRNDDSLPYGETENEIVGSRATDEQGYLSLTVSRTWMTRINDAKSIVLNTANNGIILCSNINWVEVDGSLTSTVSIVSFVAALGFVLRQLIMLFCVCSTNSLLMVQCTVYFHCQYLS